jgi:hypothetical protein
MFPRLSSRSGPCLNKSIISKLLYAGGDPPVEFRSLAEVTTFEKIQGGWKVKYEDCASAITILGATRRSPVKFWCSASDVFFSTELIR